MSKEKLDECKASRKKNYEKKWRLEHPEKLKEYSQRESEKNKERYRIDTEYQKKVKRSENKRYSEKRKEVNQKLGGKCVDCGCNVPEALEINHVNGGGSKELGRGGHGRGLTIHGKNHKALFKEILNDERKDIELVCRVCNAVHYLKLKGIEGYTVSFKSK